MFVFPFFELPSLRPLSEPNKKVKPTSQVLFDESGLSSKK